MIILLLLSVKTKVHTMAYDMYDGGMHCYCCQCRKVQPTIKYHRTYERGGYRRNVICAGCRHKFCSVTCGFNHDALCCIM